MNRRTYSRYGLWVLLACLFPPSPAFPGTKESLLQIQQQLNLMQTQMQTLQQTVASQTAVLRTLIEQAVDNVNGMKNSVAALERASAQNLATSSAKIDGLTTQIQVLGESLEEAKARIAKLSEQLAETKNAIETLHGMPATEAASSTRGANSSAAPPPPPTTPDPRTLYQSALRDYSSGQYQLGIQGFQQYLQYYGDTDLAANAQFYIGDCYYNMRDYSKAVEEYNKALERYPSGNKLAAAQLKKGYALLELEQRQAGVRELRSLISRFPNSREADLARQRLKKLGIVVPGARRG